MNRGVLIGVIVFAVVVIALIVFSLYAGNFVVNDSESGSSQDAVSEPSQERRFSIEVNANGFFPGELELKDGDVITFSNFGDSEVWIVSDDYGADLGTLASGENLDFNVEKEGTWNFYDKSNPSKVGKIIVN